MHILQSYYGMKFPHNITNKYILAVTVNFSTEKFPHVVRMNLVAKYLYIPILLIILNYIFSSKIIMLQIIYSFVFIYLFQLHLKVPKHLYTILQNTNLNVSLVGKSRLRKGKTESYTLYFFKNGSLMLRWNV